MDVTGKTVVPIFTNTHMSQEEVTAMRIVAKVLDTEQGHESIGKEASIAKKI